MLMLLYLSFLVRPSLVLPIAIELTRLSLFYQILGV
jgi:hypothetical protein